MRILHITPHLGGGVGKAHAAMSGLLARAAEQRFLLLEEPRDRRFADVIAASGAHVATVRDLRDVAQAAAAADIVQFEFWNHPRLFECLARAELAAIRTVFWAHVSGLSRPVIQPRLVEEAGRFVFSTAASLVLPAVRRLSGSARERISVINSGFGFSGVPARAPRPGATPRIAYLGTVGFEKMHPGFFDVIDALERDDVRVSVWGNVDPAVAVRARAMRHAARVMFGGPTGAPAAALAEADIFFYPLQPDHYGTAENALVEAMSLGLVPVVLDNPAEREIVRHGETGFVARSLEECAAFLHRLLSAPELRERMSRAAVREATEARSPERSARQFVELWRRLSAEPPRRTEFRRVIGDCPADWFLATQRLAGESLVSPVGSGSTSKGTLAHFESVFPADASLRRLRSDARCTTSGRGQEE